MSNQQSPSPQVRRVWLRRVGTAAVLRILGGTGYEAYCHPPMQMVRQRAPQDTPRINHRLGDRHADHPADP
jgi:hypothetical protein